MCEQLGGLAREGGPFLKIDTGAGEQSIAASSIAGFPEAACQIEFWVVGYFEFSQSFGGFTRQSLPIM
jgi:hypothetical protein